MAGVRLVGTAAAGPGWCRAGRPGSPRTPGPARPWCSSRTGRRRRPAPGSAGRRARRRPAPGSGRPARWSARERDHVAGAEHGQLAGAHRPPLGADGARAGQHVDERVEVGPPRQPELGAGLDGRVQQRDRRVRDAGAGVAGHVAGDHPEQRAAVRRAEQRDLRRPGCPGSAGSVILSRAGRFTHSWKPWNSPPLHDQLLGRRLDVQDAAARGHPLGVAVGDQAAAAVGVLVPERSRRSCRSRSRSRGAGARRCPWARPARSRPRPSGPCG